MGLKVKTITKIYTLGDGTKIVKQTGVYEKSSVSRAERQARLALRKEWQKKALIAKNVAIIERMKMVCLTNWIDTP